MSKFVRLRAVLLVLVTLAAFAFGPLHAASASAAPKGGKGPEVQPTFICRYWPTLNHFCRR